MSALEDWKAGGRCVLSGVPGSIESMSEGVDPTDPDYDPWWVDRVPVHLVGGPEGLDGLTVIAPARFTPPLQIHVLPGDPVRVRSGPNVPEDDRGWHVYGYLGVTRKDGIPEFAYNGAR